MGTYSTSIENALALGTGGWGDQALVVSNSDQIAACSRKAQKT